MNIRPCACFKNIVLFTVIVLAVLASAGRFNAAYALLEKNLYTETEKVGFAFYSLARMKPDFRLWAASEADDRAARKVKGPSLSDDIDRLNNGYRTFLPDEDLVSVHTTAVLTLPPFSAKDMADPSNPSKPIHLDLGKNITMPAFPYQVAGVWIAVVPSDQRIFKDIMVRNDVYQKLQEKLHIVNSDDKREVHIDLMLRPNRVDTTKPMNLYGKDMWLMMANVADYQIWDRQRENLLWSNSASWYLSNSSHELLDLYQH